VIVAAGNDGLFAKLCHCIGAAHLLGDKRFANNDLRTQNHDGLKVEMERAFAADSVAHWLAKLDAAGVPCGPLNNVEQALTDPQVLSRNMVVSTQDPVVGELKMAGNPIKLSAFADPSTRGRAPDLDADRAAILAGLKA
jgi:CoA:oxalate CoA-transferase